VKTLERLAHFLLFLSMLFTAFAEQLTDQKLAVSAVSNEPAAPKVTSGPAFGNARFTLLGIPGNDQCRVRLSQPVGLNLAAALNPGFALDDAEQDWVSRAVGSANGGNRRSRG
jgi:hypothetical protein